MLKWLLRTIIVVDAIRGNALTRIGVKTESVPQRKIVDIATNAKK